MVSNSVSSNISVAEHTHTDFADFKKIKGGKYSISKIRHTFPDFRQHTINKNNNKELLELIGKKLSFFAKITAIIIKTTNVN